MLFGDPVSTPRAPRKEYSSEPGPQNGSELVPKMEPRQQGPTLSKRVPACTDCISRLLLEGPFSLLKRALGKREHPYSFAFLENLLDKSMKISATATQDHEKRIPGGTLRRPGDLLGPKRPPRGHKGDQKVKSGVFLGPILGSFCVNVR